MVAVSIGTPLAGHRVASALNLGDFVYGDQKATLHATIGTRSSFTATFLSPATPLSLLSRWQADGLATLTETLGDWFRSDLVIVPPEPKQALVQGGAFLFDNNGEMKYCHSDKGTGDHVNMEEFEKVARLCAAQAAKKAEAKKAEV